jgi:hypothetical protein
VRTYTVQAPIDLPAEQVFSYLADPEHLVGFLPEPVRSDVPVEHDPVDERYRVDRARRRLLWTAQDGQHGGEVSVHEGRPGTCTVRIELHTDRPSDEAVLRAELERSVGVLAQRALAKDGPEDADVPGTEQRRSDPEGCNDPNAPHIKWP